MKIHLYCDVSKLHMDYLDSDPIDPAMDYYSQHYPRHALGDFTVRTFAGEDDIITKVTVKSDLGVRSFDIGPEECQKKWRQYRRDLCYYQRAWQDLKKYEKGENVEQTMTHAIMMRDKSCSQFRFVGIAYEQLRDRYGEDHLPKGWSLEGNIFASKYKIDERRRERAVAKARKLKKLEASMGKEGKLLNNANRWSFLNKVADKMKTPPQSPKENRKKSPISSPKKQSPVTPKKNNVIDLLDSPSPTPNKTMKRKAADVIDLTFDTPPKAETRIWI